MHVFRQQLHWAGTTAEEHTRDSVARCEGKPEVPLSAGSVYGGDDHRWNPEDLFGLAVSNCHLLTFLALARKSKLDVRAYDDEIAVTIDSVDRVPKVTAVTLAPTIRLADPGQAETARALFEKAHKYCFIANSITSAVNLEPKFE